MKRTIAAALLLAVSACDGPPPLTDTDDQTSGKRSGLTVLIDYGTGCQYLKIYSALTPRLDAAGKHICRKVSL